MSAKSATRQTRPVKNVRTAPSQANLPPNRPSTSIPQLVTEHDVQLFKLTRAYTALSERINEFEKRLEHIETPAPGSPTFEDDTESSKEGQLEVVVEES